MFSNKNIPETEWNPLVAFAQIVEVYDLTKEIVEQTIILRQSFKIKTPDAVIAAAALVHNRKLIKRNVSDFRNIPV